MDLTVIYSLTLLQLISVFAVPDNSICCVGNCDKCKKICKNCCRDNDCCTTGANCCLETCRSSSKQCKQNCLECENSCKNCCTEDCCSEVDACLQTCASTGNADAKESSSPVVAAVVSSVGALCVVVAVVVGFLLLRRKQQSQGVRTEDSPICCSAAANPDDRQNSLHVYDRLSREHKRADNNKEPENIPDKTNKDDEYTYIDDATIIKMTGRLDEDHQPATTEHPTNANPGSGLHPDLSPLYRLAGAVNNEFPDPQYPDYFILENDEKGCAEPTHYFILEERGEKKSPADTDTQQYFTLEERQEGAGRESAPRLVSPASGADYFELERPSDRQSYCAGVARHEESRGPPEDAEYSRLEPNGLEHSEYTLLTNPEHQVSTVGDNPYSLASGVE